MTDKDLNFQLENFDDLFVGSGPDIEDNFKKLLPLALEREDKSIYIQIMSQIALAQAMQRDFDKAHATLNEAEKFLTPQDNIAKARLLLERGRVLMQAGDIENARPFFFQSYEESKLAHLDFHTANAAHMIAIVASAPEEKIKWNALAIDFVEKSKSIKAQLWLGSLYNNLGQAYIEAQQYKEALDTLKIALRFREEEGYVPNIRGAKWAIARALRFLNQNEEALEILLQLNDEYDAMLKADRLDIPKEMLPLMRGMVFEELAEIHPTKSREFAKLAYEYLCQDEWFKNEKTRLERLKQLHQK